MTTLEEIRVYLRTIADMHNRAPGREKWAHHSIESMVLTYGRAFTAAPTLEIPEAGIKVDLGTRKECYTNAWRISTDLYRQELLYTEGIAVSHGIPLNHAWLTHLPTGKIVDPTWAWDNPTETQYLGIVFGEDFLRERSIITRHPSVLAPKDRIPLEFLIQGLEVDADGIVIGVKEPADADGSKH